MSATATKMEENEARDLLQQLAQEVVSKISELDASHSKELLGVFVSELFDSVAEQERREFRRQRQAEGIAAAKERGVRFGAQRIELPDGFEDMARMWSEGGISARQAAKSLGINYKTFLNRAREYCVAV